MFIEFFYGCALLLGVPGTVYLCVLSLAALRTPASPPSCAPDRTTQPARLTLLVPAHNEAHGIHATVTHLLAAARQDARCNVVVIADNCTDATAAMAQAAGAHVLVRQDANARGKGHALQFAFAHLADADWFIVVDADSRLDPGFLPALRNAMVQAPAALQARYLALEDGSPRAALAQLAWFGWNLVRPRGRAALGLSAGILGNGFALSRSTLEQVPYLAYSIVEDAEYHLQLVRAGLRVQWVDAACVRAAPAPDRHAAAAQRSRWTGGRWALLRTQWSQLLRDVLLGRSMQRGQALDLLCDMLLPPLALLVALAALLLVLAPSLPWASAAGSLLLGVGLHVLCALYVGQAGPRHWLALLRVPAYVVWSLRLLPRGLRSARAGTPWVRTPRTASSSVHKERSDVH